MFLYLKSSVTTNWQLWHQVLRRYFMGPKRACCRRVSFKPPSRTPRPHCYWCSCLSGHTYCKFLESYPNHRCYKRHFGWSWREVSTFIFGTSLCPDYYHVRPLLSNRPLYEWLSHFFLTGSSVAPLHIGNLRHGQEISKAIRNVAPSSRLQQMVLLLRSSAKTKPRCSRWCLASLSILFDRDDNGVVKEWWGKMVEPQY